MSSKVGAELAKAGKIATQYFEKIDKSLLYHADVLRETDWLLCSGITATQDDATTQITQPSILLEGLQAPDQENCYVIAVPHPSTPTSCGKLLTSQELHQIIQELVEGIYVFNQSPSSNIEGNHDCGMSCSLPSAYVDTYIGQTLLSIEYFIKSLLHGHMIPQKEKIVRLNEKWRKTVSENPGEVRQLYIDHGMVAMEDDEELGHDLYKEKTIRFIRYPLLHIDSSLTQSGLIDHLSTGETAAQRTDHICRDVFYKYLSKASLGLAVGVESVQQEGSLIVFNPSMDVTSSIEPEFDSNNAQDKDIYAHLNVYLQKQRKFVQDKLKLKLPVLKDIHILEIASFLVHLLATLRQQHKVIDCERLQPRMNSDVLKTERELPPFLPSKDSRWSPYTSDNHVVNGNGKIIMKKQEIKVSPLAECFKKNKAKLIAKAMKHEKEIMMTCINGEPYALMAIRLEDFYPKFPRKIHAMIQELKSQVTKLPTLSDTRVQDSLRRPLGPRHASKLKTMNSLVIPCIQKGLTGCVSALLKRCTKTRINKLSEEDGLSFIHHAAIHGRSDIISLLVHCCADANQLTEANTVNNYLSTGPLHLAAAAGDLDSVCSLIKHSAQMDKEDSKGWSAVHYAAYNNHQHVIGYFAKINDSCVNWITKDSVKMTPLLIAAKNGGLDTVKMLVESGANLSFCDNSNKNMVHISALKNHVNILQFILLHDSSELCVWEILVEMLKADVKSGYPHAAACVIDSLLRWNIDYWKELLKLGMIERLVDLAKMTEEKLQLLAVQVIADISNHSEVKSVLVKSNAIPTLVKHLSSTNDRLQSTTCIVLSDLGLDDENKSSITANGGMKSLMILVSSPQDDIQLYASACIGILVMNSDDNKNLFRDNGGLQYLIAMLKSPLDCHQGTAASAIEEILNGCRENQLAALHEDIIPPLVTLLRSRTTSVHSNAANAVRALAADCAESQIILQKESTQCTALLRRLLKSLAPGVKVCAGTALWAIAGDQTENRRVIAHFMGLDTLIDLLAIHDSRLDYVCSEALGALAGQMGDYQYTIYELGGLIPLVEVLISKSSEHVYISVLNTLGSLLTKPGLVPNVELQKAVADARGLTFITALVLSPLEESIRVNAACTLAKLVLNNKDNEEKLCKQTGFSYLAILKLLGSDQAEIRKMAGYALSVFVFNNPKRLEMIKSMGSINLSNFTSLLESSEQHQAHSAFQLIILSRIILDIRPVDASIYGIKTLVKLSNSPSEKTKLLCLEFLACLARSREGVPMTSVMAGALSPLMDNLLTKNPPVEEMSSVAIGFYSYVPLASRLIRSRFRSDPILFTVFEKYLKFANPSKQFLDDWHSTEKAGLPSLSLEKHGGPAVGEGWKSSSKDGDNHKKRGSSIKDHEVVLQGLKKTSIGGPLTTRKKTLNRIVGGSQLPTMNKN